MSDDDKSMGVQLICNQRVVAYNKFLGMNPMVPITPWYNSLEIISLCPVLKFDKGLTQWALVPLGSTIKTNNYSQI